MRSASHPSRRAGRAAKAGRRRAPGAGAGAGAGARMPPRMAVRGPGSGRRPGAGAPAKGRAAAVAERPGAEAPPSGKSGPGAAPFTKLLAANRGEIAIRIFRACAELDVTSVAAYSKEDHTQQHRYKADESYLVGDAQSTPVGAYLDVESVINMCKKNGVEAVHPGYGFLSENATFARRLAEEGIAFVGPKPETLEQLGDKTKARVLAQECGVPVVPGTDEALVDEGQALEYAQSIGFPVILKAAMGGGGRGMRIVREEGELTEQFKRASNEALTAFGDGRMFVEKFVEGPRHIEIQILADHYGNVMHLHERDCSVQRRHQKVVEIAPSQGLSDATRESLFADAIRLAQHVGYRNAGTVEFMVAEDGSYYFLEVNPRVQVEHTVTEEVTGVDIVQSQIKIAAGASLADLGLTQEGVQPRGFAIQARITSEDPEANFQPDSGRIEAFRSPGGLGIRLDGHISSGGFVSPHYDSLMVKLTAKGANFEIARKKLDKALREFRIRGIKTNIPFICNVLENEKFIRSATTTNFVDETPELFDLAGSKVMADPVSRYLAFLADMVVNGPQHAGAVGPPPSKMDPVIPEPEPADGPLTGFKDVLDAQGPQAYAEAVRSNPGLLLTDTTWRDAHQSLLATRMRTTDLLAAAPYTAQALAGCASLEMWGGATFDVSYRFLGECPWERLAKLRQAVPNVPFQMLLRGANGVGYSAYSDNVVREFVRLARQEGVDVFRVFDSLNYVDNIKFGMDAVHTAGGVVEGTICYTGDVSSPRETKYTLDYYLTLARELVASGTHILAIKDMAGLLKPKAATLLVSALRREFPLLPIHVHTHDTAGAGVASMVAAAEAGADIVDTAIDSMSGMTSQPSMGAVVNAVRGSDLDTGIDPKSLMPLISYWEQTRGLYAPFESGLKSGSSDVYFHEMPGGQMTNLKFQAYQNGLGDEWDNVKEAYANANRLLGNIVKVTPSSKVVGDLAQFMVQNDLDEENILEKAEKLDFPSSVVDFMAGYLGQPTGGFPEPLRSKVLKGREPIEGRPGASLNPRDLEGEKVQLQFQYGRHQIDDKDTISAAMYPDVFRQFKNSSAKFGNLSKLPTRTFLAPMEPDEEVTFEVEDPREGSSAGRKSVFKYLAKGELLPSGQREVFFEVNGLPRTLLVQDRTESEKITKSTNQKADSTKLGSIGAPMTGSVVEVLVEAGQDVTAGEPLVVLSAMKMETTVSAPCTGMVQHVGVLKEDTVNPGDLLVEIDEDEVATLAAAAAP